MPDGANPLSKREQEILTLVARGLTNQEIARELVLSPNTVKVHLRNIFEKLGVASRTEAIVRAAQGGWIEVAGLDEEPEGTSSLATPQSADVPLASWQRVYLVLAAILVAAALLGPGLLDRLQAAPAANDLSDWNLPRLGIPPRRDVGRWEQLAPMPVARSRLGLAPAGGLLFAVGGETAQGVTAAVEAYDPALNRWSSRAAKPTAVSNAQAAALNGLVYVPGGTLGDGTVTAVLEVYDPQDDTWQEGTPLPEARAGHALAALDGRLYVAGGWDGSRYVDTLLIYDPSAGRWDSGPQAPAAFGFGAAAALGDRILIAGGYDGSQEVASCWLYYPPEARWESCAPLIAPRGGLGLAADGAAVYAIGGGWTEPLGFNERYDSLTNTWASLPTPIDGQWRHLGVASEGALIYAVGGWSGDYLDGTEAFQGPFRAFLPFGAREQ